MKKIHNRLVLVTIISILYLFNLTTTAQNFDNYTNIKSSGKIPSDFLLLSSSKFEADKTTISKDEEDFIKRSKKKFYLETNFLVDELLHNGKVLYNDPIGMYVNKVVANILVNKPLLKEKIRVYVVLSDIVNAYATNNGIIFINIGLLAKLENEAQLAFILGHEITHYEKNHVLNRYVLNEKIQRKKIRIDYSDSDVESILFSKTSYQKEQEIESDIESTKLLLGTLYNPRAGMDVMRILASDIPLKNKYHFSSLFFAKDSSLTFAFDSVNFEALKYTEDLQTESKTHPALSQRIQTIAGLSDSATCSQANFILPEEEFYTIQKIAQFEVAKIFLKKGNPAYAFYCIYQLLQDNPNNRYLNDLLCKTFYLAAKSHKDHIDYNEQSENSTDWKTIDENSPKEIQFMHAYLRQLSGAELNILSIYFYVHTYPSQQIIADQIRLRDLLYDLKFKYGGSDAFEHITSGQSPIKSIPFVNTYLSSLSQKQENSLVIADSIPTKKQKIKTSFSKIDNLIILDPVYKKFDLRRKTEEKFIASEKSLVAYNEQIKIIADELNINQTIVSPIGWTENDTIAFYNHSLFKGQVEEVLTNGSQTISTDFELVDTTCSSYKSSHLALMGTYSFHIQKHIVTKIIVFVWSAFLFPTLPIGIYYVVTPSYRTYTYLVTINSKNQAVDFKHLRLLKYKDSMGAINSSTYYQLLKMKLGK